MIALNEPFQLFTEEQCEALITRAQAQEIVQGQTYSNRLHVRNNDIVWFSLEQNEYNNMWELVKDYWEEVHWFEHPIQISRYSTGQYYDWHSDNKPNRRRTSKRHLTLTCTLRAAPGAVFETELGTYDLQPGQAILIPSSLQHRACSPTEGERWSLTVWYMQRHEST